MYRADWGWRLLDEGQLRAAPRVLTSSVMGPAAGAGTTTNPVLSYRTNDFGYFYRHVDDTSLDMYMSMTHMSRYNIIDGFLVIRYIFIANKEFQFSFFRLGYKVVCTVTLYS